jgi:hypothetical protein
MEIDRRDLLTGLAASVVAAALPDGSWMKSPLT